MTVLDVLGQYPGFVTDMLALGGPDGFRRLGRVSFDLVGYAVVGILVAAALDAARAAWVLREARAIVARSGPYGGEFALLAHRLLHDVRSPAGYVAAASGRRVVSGLVALALGAAALHTVLLAYHALYRSAGIGNLSDSLNAVAASVAVLAPVTAFGGLAQRVGETPGRLYATTGRVVLSIAVTLVLTIAPGLWASLASLDAVAAIHGTSRWYLVPPVVALAVVALPLAALAERRSFRAGN